MNPPVLDQSELQAELAKLRAEKMDRARWNWLAIGFLSTLALSVGFFLFVVRPAETRAIDALAAKLHETATARDDLQKKNEALSQLLQVSRNQVTALSLPESETPAYTLLYDPAPAGSSSNSAMAMLNLVKPGLGTALEKLSAASQAQGPMGNPRWLIPGFTKPIVNGNSQGFYYQWANLQTHEVETFTPKGTTLSQPN